MIFLLVVIAFFIGSIPTGLLIAKNKGIDLRKVGSGNIGATNVMRAVGKKEAVYTLLGDIGKGWLPLFMVRLVVLTGSFNNAPAFAQAQALGINPVAAVEGLVGLAAILGHNFSVFLRFRGGKGVATSLGVLLALSPYTGLFTIMIWIMTFKRSKISSLSALAAFGALPLSIYILDFSREKTVIAIIITILIFLRHTANIKRLINGTESRMGPTV